jgi:hypothetical protein
MNRLRWRMEGNMDHRIVQRAALGALIGIVIALAASAPAEARGHGHGGHGHGHGGHGRHGGRWHGHVGHFYSGHRSHLRSCAAHQSSPWTPGPRFDGC